MCKALLIDRWYQNVGFRHMYHKVVLGVNRPKWFIHQKVEERW